MKPKKEYAIKKFIITEVQIEQIIKHIPKKDHLKTTHYFYEWHILNILKNVQENPI